MAEKGTKKKSPKKTTGGALCDAENKRRVNKKKQVQPKHHAGKSKAVATARRKKIIKSIIAGKTQKEAGIEAGLSPKTAPAQVNAILKEPETQAKFKEILDKYCPDEEIAAKYKELMSAKKVISAMVVASNGEGMKDANSMTRDFVEVDDCAVQLKTCDSIAKLKGHVVDKTETDVNLNITEIPIRFIGIKNEPR